MSELNEAWKVSLPFGCLLMYNEVKRMFLVNVLIVDASRGFNSVKVVPISPRSRPVDIKLVLPSARMMSRERVNIFLHSVAALVSLKLLENINRLELTLIAENSLLSTTYRVNP